MWKSGNRIMTDKEVCSFIESKPHRIIVLTGPTMCGKTSLLKSVDIDKKLMVSAELFSEVAFRIARNKKYDITESLMHSFGDHDCLCIEDLDMFHSGYSVICLLAAGFFREALKSTTIVFTGVDIDKWDVFSDFSDIFNTLYIRYHDGTQDSSSGKVRIISYNDKPGKNKNL